MIICLTVRINMPLCGQPWHSPRVTNWQCKHVYSRSLHVHIFSCKSTITFMKLSSISNIYFEIGNTFHVILSSFHRSISFLTYEVVSCKYFVATDIHIQLFLKEHHINCIWWLHSLFLARNTINVCYGAFFFFFQSMKYVNKFSSDTCKSFKTLHIANQVWAYKISLLNQIFISQIISLPQK